MGRIKTKHATRIKCDCGAANCDHPDFVSYSIGGIAQKQAKAVGWRRRKQGDVHWFAPKHHATWEHKVIACKCGKETCTALMQWSTTQGVRWRRDLARAGWTGKGVRWFAKGHAPPPKAKAQKAAA